MSDIAGPSQPRKRAHSAAFSPEISVKKARTTGQTDTKRDKKRRRKKKKKLSITAQLRKAPKDPEPGSETLSSTPPSPDRKGKGKAREIDDDPDTIITRLTEELQSQALKLRAYDEAVRRVQDSLTCQICLEVLRRPYALAPCGHVSCHGCLFQWFTAPRDGELKTCPHCRAPILRRPIEIYAIKNTVHGLLTTGLLADVPASDALEEPLGEDVWNGLFGSRERQQMEDERDVMGVFDAEDNVYRCQDCMHEIWDGACSGCDREYPDNHYQRQAQPPIPWNFPLTLDDEGDDFIALYTDDSEDGGEDDEELEGSFIDDDEDQVIDVHDISSDDHSDRPRRPPTAIDLDISSSDEGDDVPHVPLRHAGRRTAILDSSEDEDEDAPPTRGPRRKVHPHPERPPSPIRQRLVYRIDSSDSDDPEELVLGDPDEDDDVYRRGAHRRNPAGFYEDEEDLIVGDDDEESDGSLSRIPSRLHHEDSEEDEEDDGSLPGIPRHLRAEWDAAEDSEEEY